MAISYYFTQPKLSKTYILSIFSGHWRLLYSPRAARPLAKFTRTNIQSGPASDSFTSVALRTS